jgi:hypothetical protein
VHQTTNKVQGALRIALVMLAMAACAILSILLEILPISGP